MDYKVSDLVALLDCEIKGVLRLERISNLAPFFQAEEGSITFASDEKFIKKLDETRASVIIVPRGVALPELNKMFLIVDENPRILMPKILNFFKRKLMKSIKIIEDSAIIGENSLIGPNVYIGHSCIIGSNVNIMPGAVIGEGVKIGDNSIINANVVIREFCELGKNCIIQPGAVIGSDGFGYVKVNGINEKIEQIGAVIIGDNVEIGANTTVDRGAIGNTIIKSNTKIDNLVQIAHNDIIGENCLIISQVGIAGSTEIGDNTIIAGQAGIGGHLKIGKNVVIAAKSGVTGNIQDDLQVSGFPLVAHREDMKIKSAIRKLPNTYKKIKEIEKTLKSMIK